MNKIAIIGAGNLGSAIAEGLIKKSVFSANQLIATRNQLHFIEHLKEKGIHITANNSEAVREANIIILCVKPYKVKELITELNPVLTSDKILITVVTGLSLKSYEDLVKSPLKIFRAMPNTAASVEESLTCICSNTTDKETTRVVQTIFNAIGETVFIQEELMNAATVVGACGIAYVLRFMRAMIQGGIEIGFDAQTASKIVNQTVKGAAQLLIENGLHPEQEIDKVTTPKGCTIAGLNEMEHQGFSSSLIKGIKTSFEKID